MIVSKVLSSRGMNNLKIVMKIIRNRICVHLFLAISVILSVQGVGTVYGEGPGFLNEITKGAYPNAHAVLAYEQETVEFQKDGSSVETDEVYLTLLDQDGVQHNSVSSFYINRHYSRLEIKRFQVIGSDGTIKDVDLDRYSRQDNLASASRMNIYDPSQGELKVFVPELKPGDTIHYKVVQHNFKSMIPGEFFGKKRAEYTFPIRHYRLIIKGPSKKRLYTLVKAAQPEHLTEKVTESDGITSHMYEFRDVPALVPEPAMPPISQVGMRILYSTVPCWQEVSRWYSSLVEPHLAPSPAIKRKVRELTQDREGERERLAAIFYFVAQKIRYMGITAERDRPGYEPHDVSLTFSRRYGVCRDKAALLVTMLREAGFDAVPVMIRAGGILDKEIVVPWFNHAITAVVNKDGSPVLFLDPTSETSRQFLPDYERHSSCLPATPRGAELQMTPDPDAGANLTVITVKDRLHEDGTLTGSVEFLLTGFCDTALRGAMMYSSHEKRKQLVEQLVKARAPGITVTEVKWSDPADRSRPLTVGCDFSARNRTGALLDGTPMFYPVGSMEFIGVLDKHLLARASLSHRKYPLRFDYVVKSILSEKTELPGWVRNAVLHPAMELALKDVHARYEAGMNGGVLETRREFAISAIEVAPEDYKEILKLQQFMNNAATIPVIFQK